jgi:T5SS/PEP-CTERM-associated repeat protein
VHAVIGGNPTGNGQVTVSGTGSEWINSNEMLIGNFGTGIWLS